MGQIQQWGSYDIDAAEEEAELVARSGGNEFMKLEVGRTVVRFLPPKVGQRSPFVIVHQHFVQLNGMQSPASFNCPRMMSKQPCLVCQEVERLRATGNAADYEMAGQLFPRLRIFANVINRKAEESGPQILPFGKQIHSDLIALRQDKDAGGDFCDPETGFDIIIERTGTGKTDTKYTVRPARQTSPLGDLDWIAAQGDLTRYAAVLSMDDIKKKLGGALGGHGSGGAPPRTPARALARGPAAAARPTPSRTAVQDAEMVDGDEE